MNLFKIAFLFSTLFFDLNACTRVCCNRNSSQIFFARTLDLFVDEKPKIVVYPRGIQRKSFAGEYPKKWKSKYASIATTAFGKDFITDGMNEAGLAAHLIFVENAHYDRNHSLKASISNLQLAGYVLDNFKTVNETLEHLQKVQVISTLLANQRWSFHLVLEDIMGDTAVIEFIGGGRVIHQGPQYQIVTTGQSFEELLKNRNLYQPFGGKSQIPGDQKPISRFVRVSTYFQTLPNTPDPFEKVVGLLSLLRTAQVPFGVNHPWETRWISLGDLSKKVYYFSSAMHPNLIWAKLENFDLSENGLVKELNPNQDGLVSDVSRKFINANPFNK